MMGIATVVLLGLTLLPKGQAAEQAPAPTPAFQLCLDYDTMTQGEGNECS